MSSWRKERELSKKMELPLGRRIWERKHSGPLADHGQKEIGCKRKKGAPQKLGHRGSRETDFPSGKSCLRVIGFARVASIINK